MKGEICVFWFRRDLRLSDNVGLYHALNSGHQVIPLFIFDTNILSELQNQSDRRVDFFHQALTEINQILIKNGSSIITYYGEPLTAFKKLLKTHDIQSVYTNDDYEPYAITRDSEIKNYLEKRNILFFSYKDQCIFHKDDVLKKDGSPYTVFTPYCKTWKKQFKKNNLLEYPTQKYYCNFYKQKATSIPTLEKIGFSKTDMIYSHPLIDTKLIAAYQNTRDIPSLNGTSRLSVHFRFGTISIRQAVKIAIEKSEIWLNELIWREFYKMILYHFPAVEKSAFKKKYERIKWRNNEKEFQLWCQGKTGFPIVDAGMRELNATGFMHNRVRMITASFLVKDLLIDWRWGEAYFAEKLVDYDLSSNNGGWQWAAGTGCDAAPYFRIFNPTSQQKKFDPNFSYIKKWIPEFGSEKYPEPIVNHSEARIRALNVYKEALTNE